MTKHEKDFETLRKSTLEFAACIAESEEVPATVDGLSMGIPLETIEYVQAAVRSTKRCIAKRIRDAKPKKRKARHAR